MTITSTPQRLSIINDAGFALWEEHLPSKQGKGGFDPHSPLHHLLPASLNSAGAKMRVGQRGNCLRVKLPAAGTTLSCAQGCGLRGAA